MDDRPVEDLAVEPPVQSQAELEALLDASEADVRAGRLVAAGPVLARMRAAAEAIRRKRATTI